MQLMVKSLRGDVKPVTVPADASLTYLRKAVAEVFGIAQESVKLVFRSRGLEGDAPLSSFGLADGDSLVLVTLKVKLTELRHQRPRSRTPPSRKGGS